MAFTANKNLNSDPQVTLKDWRHAARMFGDDQFRLAPKVDFAHHIAFNINTAALKNTALVQRYGNEINMLAKAVSLPKFEIKADSVNQYNRKKNVQYHYTIGAVAITFYDDNMSLINQLWQNYYSYYYADSTSAKSLGAYQRNATKSSNYITTPYGLDNASTNPFFNHITIYQMARHEWVSAKLINPIITAWDGQKLDWGQSKPHEFIMTVTCEAVTYDMGANNGESAPEGFGQTHYDNTPSPLTGLNPDPTVFNPSFVQSLDVETIAPGILSNTINTINTYQNTRQPNTPVTESGLTTTYPITSVSGLPDIAFPQSPNVTNNTTEAKKISI